MPKSPMEDVLATLQSHSPGAWVRENDPDQHYVVTAVSHYREKSPDFQPEYLLQPHPDHPQPLSSSKSRATRTGTHSQPDSASGAPQTTQ